MSVKIELSQDDVIRAIGQYAQRKTETPGEAHVTLMVHQSGDGKITVTAQVSLG